MSGWTIKRDTDVGADDGFWEWWTVSNDAEDKSFKCDTEEEAEWLANKLNNDKQGIPGYNIKYWLCCGSTDPEHKNTVCMERKIAPQNCRFGTILEHYDKAKSKNKEHCCINEIKQARIDALKEAIKIIEKYTHPNEKALVGVHLVTIGIQTLINKEQLK